MKYIPPNSGEEILPYGEKFPTPKQRKHFVIKQNKVLQCLHISSLHFLTSSFVINRIMDGTEDTLRDEQCGFRRGRGCVDQVFVVRQGCEKYLEREKDFLGLYGPRKGL